MRCFAHALAPFSAALAVLVLATSAHAHATLERTSAPAGSFYKAVIGITHGCDGSGTVAVRVTIPEGDKRAKPMPKPGWQLAVRLEPLDEPYEWYGATVTEDVREIVWRGGPLPDAHYDEFAFRAKLPDAEGQTIYFETIQECEDGAYRWVEHLEPGAHGGHGHAKSPAPALLLTAPEAHH